MVMEHGRLTGAIELMDQPNSEPAELAHTLTDLAWINRWLGGQRVVRVHLAPFLQETEGPIHILDVGTGDGDIPRAIAQWGRRSGVSVDIEAIDHHEQIVKFAQQASASYPEVRIRQGDALALPYPDESFTIVLASLVLHHMEGEDQIRLLRELYRVASRAVVVNDLRRGIWPFLVTWAALHIVSQNHVIHHDGPMSVRRGFLPEELCTLARLAGWGRVSVLRHAFFRLALVGQKV